EDAEHHNCVFVGYEGDTPRYGALRGTLSESTFVGDVPGSDKRFSFAVPMQAGSGGTLCVFECAIDALSYLTLLKMRGQDWRKANTLSLAGIYQPKRNGEIKFPIALGQFLKDNPQIERVILCLDNDGPGRAATAAIKNRLAAYDVVDNPPRSGKDYNGLLQLRMGIAGRVKTRGGEAR
ncbi:MAG: toprim domain-containing protein, partial [Oscillospiraceae bacterium]|nr:toprim domain-containing protein [Oscillospiraceae bacterium]